MNVDIISKISHARATQEMLERNGHKVTLLGSEAPDRLSVKTEVLVVRSTSCSHAATDFAVEVHRKKEIPVLFEIGATRITELVNKLAKDKEAKEKNLNTVKDKLSNELDKLNQPTSWTIDSAAERLLNLTGFWTNFLVSQRNNADKMVDRLSSENLIQPHQRAEVGSLLTFLHKKSAAGISSAGRNLRKTIQGKPEFMGVHYMAPNNAMGTMVVRSSFPKEKVDRILNFFKLTRSLGEIQKNLRAPTSASAPILSEPKADPKIEAKADSKVRDIEDLATPTPIPTLDLAAPSPNPESASMEELVENVESKRDANLRAAIELLVSAMQEGSYKEIIVDDKGNVSFKRVRVQVGSFKV